MLTKKPVKKKSYEIPHRIIPIDGKMLMTATGMAFNPSIIEVFDKTYMFYRYESGKENASTNIGVVELDQAFNPIIETNSDPRLPRFSSKITTLDDPRAFLVGGRLYVIYAQGVVVPRGVNDWRWCSSVAICHLGRNLQRVDQWLPRYGHNFNFSSGGDSYESEKNWSPFAYGNRMMFIYQINPLIVLDYNLDLQHTTEVNRSKFDPSFWKHGEFLGGGTPMMRRGNEYIGFFHSFTNDHPNKPNCRTYHVGYYVMSGEPPFRILRMSAKPILTAKPDDARDLRGPSSPWRPNCIYPCGFIIRGNKVYMSQGWQDCRCEIVEMDIHDLEASCREVKQVRYEATQKY